MNHQIGNLIDAVKEGVILQQVNAQNVMGSGFARALYERYPEVKARYHTWCSTYPTDLARMGKIDVIEVERGLCVINIVGQRYYGRDMGRRYTSYDALDDGFQGVATWLSAVGLSSADVHFPLLGSDLGGGNWATVQTLIEHRIGTYCTLWTLPKL